MELHSDVIFIKCVKALKSKVVEGIVNYQDEMWSRYGREGLAELEQAEINPYSRVALLLFSSKEVLKAIAMLLKYKCNIVFVNPYFQEREIVEIVKKCDYILCDNLEYISLFGKYKFIKKSETVFWVMNEEKACDDDGVTTDSFVFFTSGSTGKAKEVYKKKETCFAEARGLIEKLKLSGEDVLFSFAPCYHVYGQSLSLAAMLAGAKVKYVNIMYPYSRILKELRKGIYTILVGTPVLYNKMYRELEEINSVRLFLNAGGFVSKEVTQSNLLINNQYGSTETGAIAIQNERRYAAAGNVGSPLEGVEVSGTERIKVGVKLFYRFSVNTPYLAYKVIEAGEEKRLNNPYMMSDFGWISDDGTIHLEGRMDDIINYYGVKFSTKEVENVLKSHPKVKNAYVKKRFSQVEYASAYVAVFEGQELSEQELLRFCAERLSTYKLPKKISFVNTLEQNAVGKILIEE